MCVCVVFFFFFFELMYFFQFNVKWENSADVGAENASNSHPYGAEITKLLESPKLELNLPSDDGDLEMSESYIWVQTESQLQDLAAALSKQRVFAVDTEQHSLRSFLGFTALVQVNYCWYCCFDSYSNDVPVFKL